MKFNTKELEIISHALALVVDEMEHKENRAITQSMLGKMQDIGIWGTASFHNANEEHCGHINCGSECEEY
jgi:hypothetical protein